MTAYNLSCVRINEQSAQMRFLYFTRFLNIAQPLVLQGLFRCKPLGRVSLQNPLHEVLCGWRDASPQHVRKVNLSFHVLQEVFE